MQYRTANYVAFYVKEPFSTSNLQANATPDFVHYNQLKAWKKKDTTFSFVDAHARTYNVRDDSEWETLKTRLHERLCLSKNIILFLSTYTKRSKALCEEIDYGVNKKGLPVIVVYPDFDEPRDIYCSTGIRKQVEDLWNQLPVFRDSMHNVATIHIPYRKEYIKSALLDSNFTVQHMTSPKSYYYKE